MYLLLSDRIDELTYIIMSLSFRLQQMKESGGCPYIHFRLYEDCQRMTSSYVQMVSDIKRHVSHLAAAENQGVVPIISAGQIFPGPAAGEAYCKYKTLVLPSVPNHNMHFVVVLHTPPNWAGGTREPVRLLFAIRTSTSSASSTATYGRRSKMPTWARTSLRRRSFSGPDRFRSKAITGDSPATQAV